MSQVLKRPFLRLFVLASLSYMQGARFTEVKWHSLVIQQAQAQSRSKLGGFKDSSPHVLSACSLCRFFIHTQLPSLSCTLNTESLARLLSCHLKSATSCHAASASAVSPCFAAAAARLSCSDNSSDLGTLAQELQWKELSGEVEERLSRPEQVEGDLITMRKSDCNMPQSRTACLRELCMPRIQEEPSVYAYTYLYTQTQHVRDSRRGH